MMPPPELPRPSQGHVYLGWQYAVLHPDPGPLPRRPVPPRQPQLSREWLAAQRREENLLDRPLKIAVAAVMVVMVVAIVVVTAGWLPALPLAPVFAGCVFAGGFAGYAIWQGERALRERVAAERRRVERFRADAERQLFAWQAEHARQVKEWQSSRFAYENQKRWYAVPLPAGIDRVDVVGGTLPGWSALLTMTGAYRLAAGGEVTVLDLSGGAIAADLLAVAEAAGIAPNIWVLPGDLPRLDLTASLPPASLADVLATASDAATGSGGGDDGAGSRGDAGDPALDNSILERVLGVLGSDTGMPRVAAGLRTLAQVGDPYDDIAAGVLTEEEASQLSTLFGRDATDRVVLERALSLQARVGKLATAATDPRSLPHSALRVVAIDQQAGTATAEILGCFVVTALTHLLARLTSGQRGRSGRRGRSGKKAEPWQHTVFLLGAERLRGDVTDRLAGACETSRTGLVLAYRSVPRQVRQRIGRGNAAVAFMRLGNAEDAKAASEQIGTQHRFVLSQLTETVGSSVTDTTGTSYTSTVGGSESLAASDSASDSTSTGTGKAADSSFLPFAGTTSRSREKGSSRGVSQTESITEGISASTAWGASTSLATGSSESLARSVQRSREFLVEASELQRLPPTAMILSYATAAGRQVLMADVNPAIGGLAVATTAPLAEAGLFRATPPAPPPPRPDIEEPNLGPPAARLDWRRR
ncbi:MAG: hypothetical protein J2P25_12830 [Nocardiopsaceae bacterium]|nr:hypothetical protein [Nocardiopsaceae bacterium]